MLASASGVCKCVVWWCVIWVACVSLRSRLRRAASDGCGVGENNDNKKEEGENFELIAAVVLAAGWYVKPFTNYIQYYIYIVLIIDKYKP